MADASDPRLDTDRQPAPRAYHDVRDDYDDEFGRALSPREVARRRLIVPSVAFLVIGVLCILGTMAGSVAVVIEFVERGTRPSKVLALAIAEGLLLVGAGLVVLVTVGGACMLRRRRYRLALFGAYVVTSLSLAGPYGVLFFPFGIWALILLYRPDVRAEFGRTVR